MTTNKTGFLDKLERICSKIPQPIVFFLWLMLISVVFSVILSNINASFTLIAFENGVAVDKVHYIKNILSAEGIRFVLINSISKISSTNIMPILIMSIIGLGLAEGSGYIRAVFVSILSKFKSSGQIATILLLFFGVISNVASDAGYLILVPLGALIFATTKRNPILGAAVAFAGVSGGFTANLFLSGSDALLAGISTTAVRLIIPDYTVTIQSNYYFSIVSTFVIVLAGYILTEFVMIKRWKYDSNLAINDGVLEKLSPLQKKALRVGNSVFLVCVVTIMLGILPTDGILRNPETGDLWKNSALSYGIIMLFTIIFGLSGLAYGIVAKTIQKADDAIKMFSSFIAMSAGALGLVIFAYQFLNILEFTKLGVGFAAMLVKGIKAVNANGVTFVVMTVLAVAIINLFITGMSSKWVAISYILIPTFIGLGYTPELAQAAYRVGDSITNIISPTMSYMPIILSVFQKYKKDANVGTIVAIMIPYSFVFTIAWTTLLIIFLMFGLPLGPDVKSYL
jgi:aminobenzoyl-glutamate transport protein